jgi:hypothetical protein
MIPELVFSSLVALNALGGFVFDTNWISRFSGTPVVIGEVRPIKTDLKTDLKTEKAVVEPFGPPTLEEHVRDYFADAPILAEIARCESRFRQQNRDGSTFRGEINHLDIGVMQINEHYHLTRSVKLGFDIHTLDGNLGYAKWLYGRYGTDPWVHSSRCWGQSDKVAFNI